jgi:hypothetical protein
LDEKNDNDGILKSSRISDSGCLVTGEPSMSLKTMTVSKLKVLKHQVEAAIHTKVTERRYEIESELLKLSRFDGGRGAKVVRAGARGMVAVKYRKPGPSLKAAKKLDESLTADSPKASTPKQPKKTKKASKTRKAANNAPASVSILATADHIEPLPIEPLPIAPLPIEPLPIEPLSVTSTVANVIPADLSAAA